MKRWFVLTTVCAMIFGLAAASPEVEIMEITVLSGNVDLEQAAKVSYMRKTVLTVR